MILLYLVKSSLCLAVLLLFYKIVLERLPMHHFKRWFLLGSIVFSLTVPLITFTYTTIIPINTAVIDVPNNSFEHTTTPTTQETIPTKDFWNYVPVGLWTIYSLGVLFFGIRFARNLFRLKRKVQRHQKIKFPRHTDVLLNKPEIPHSFLRFIFIHKKAYEAGHIPPEVLLHEQTHVRQKHSIDILCIELLQVIFWFNPLLWFSKKAIKLNHEFLADQHALKASDQPNYQNLLFQYSGSTDHTAFTSAINYSLTKKRILMMSQTFSRKRALLSVLLAIPIIAGCLLVFNNKIVEKQETTAFISEKWDVGLTARSIDIELLGIENYKVDGIKSTKENLAKTLSGLHTDLTKEQRDRVINIHISSEGSIPYNELLHIQKVATDYGYHRIVTPKEEIVRSKGNVPMVNVSSNQNHSQASEAQMAWYNAFIDDIKRTNMISMVKYNKAKRIYHDIMSDAQRATAAKLPEIPLPSLDNVKAQQPSKTTFEGWKDKDKYALWLDGKVIENAHLNAISYTDIEHHQGSFVHKNARNEKFPQPYQFHLYTKKGFDKTFKNHSKTTAEKTLEIQVDNTLIMVNGTRTTLENFTKTINGITSDWTKDELNSYHLDVSLKNTTNNFMKKLDAAFKKTRVYKANPDGHGLIPEPPTPPSAPAPPSPPSPPSPPKLVKPDGVLKVVEEPKTTKYVYIDEPSKEGNGDEIEIIEVKAPEVRYVYAEKKGKKRKKGNNEVEVIKVPSNTNYVILDKDKKGKKNKKQKTKN